MRKTVKTMANQIQQVVALLLSFPQMLALWNATEFVFLSDDCVGFKVSTPRYSWVVKISFAEDLFFVVEFEDCDLKVMGIVGAERVMDVVKDFVERGEVWG